MGSEAAQTMADDTDGDFLFEPILERFEELELLKIVLGCLDSPDITL